MQKRHLAGIYRAVASVVTVVTLMSGIAGCGKKAGKSAVDSDTTEQSNTDYADIYQSRERVDLLDTEWKASGEVQNPDIYWTIADYLEPDFGEREGKSYFGPYYAVDGTDFYTLSCYFVDGLEAGCNDREDYYLDRIDGNTLEVSSVPFSSLEAEGVEGGRIVGFDVSGGRIMLFVQTWDKMVNSDGSHDTNGYYAIQIEADGSFGASVNLYPAMCKANLNPLPDYMMYGALWDARGYYYYPDSDRNTWYVFDTEGKQVGEIYRTGQREVLEAVCKSPEGAYIWMRKLQGTTSYELFKPEGMKLLYQGELMTYATDCCLNPYGEMIMVAGGTDLTNWDLRSGERTRRYAGTRTTFGNAVGMLQNDQGQVVVFSAEDILSISTYSAAGPAVTANITVEVPGVYDYATRQAINDYERTHPGITFKVKEYDYESRDSEWNNLVNRLTAGEGPDLIICFVEQMRQLAAGKYVQELSNVLPQEITDRMYAELLNQGRVDGKLYGIVYAGMTETLLVNEDVWQGDSWTIEEMLEVLKENSNPGVICPVAADYYQTYMTYGPEQLLNVLLTDLEHSPFVDLQRGTCDFESAAFLRLLETCKRLGTGNEQCEESVVEHFRYGDFTDFSDTMFRLKEKWHCVGFPTDGDSGHYWFSTSCMTVNKYTDNREIIVDFIKTLYNEKNQMETMVAPIFRDYLGSKVYTSVDWGIGGYLRLDAHRYQNLQLKKNGESFLSEYEDMLDKCVPKPMELDMVREIILEEADAFFNGRKDARGVAEIIQSRASLYLAEQQ